MAPADSSSVHLTSLHDFRDNLASRLTEVDSMLTTLRSDPVLTDRNGSVRPPRLGTFEDADKESTQYATLYQQYLQRLRRLREAVTAAQAATTTIIDNYQTTETLNAASATDISRALAGINTALGGPTDG